MPLTDNAVKNGATSHLGEDDSVRQEPVPCTRQKNSIARFQRRTHALTGYDHPYLVPQLEEATDSGEGPNVNLRQDRRLPEPAPEASREALSHHPLPGGNRLEPVLRDTSDSCRARSPRPLRRNPRPCSTPHARHVRRQRNVTPHWMGFNPSTIAEPEPMRRSSVARCGFAQQPRPSESPT